MSMTTRQWSFGERVVHAHKPEWGAGMITAAHNAEHEGRPCQMLTIRFDRAGLKTLSTAFALLVPADSVPAHVPGQAEPEADPLAFGGDAPDPREQLLRLPDDATDPFTTPAARLRATLGLYRFSPSARSLLDWAAAQTGLADPLSRFNRHELERSFEQFAVVRDNHLRKMAQETRKADPAALAQAVATAPPAAQQAMRRLDALR